MITETQSLNLITNAFAKKKFIGEGYLVAHYTREDLLTIQHHTANTLSNLNQCIIAKAYTDFGMSNFEAFALKAFIESQVFFLNKAIKYLECNFDSTSIEGDILEFQLNQN